MFELYSFCIETSFQLEEVSLSRRVPVEEKSHFTFAIHRDFSSHHANPQDEEDYVTYLIISEIN